MGLFTAIPISEKLKGEIKELQNSLPNGIRHQSHDQMHITLRFLGKTSAAKAETVKAQLQNIQSPSFKLAIKGAGTFSKKGKPKVIWAGVKKEALLLKLQKEIEHLCINNGLKPEKRTFTPHITIGRVKNASPRKVKKWMNRQKSWKGEKLRVDRFVLYKSMQKSEGVIHKVVKKYFF